MQTLNESEAIQIASGTVAEGVGNGIGILVKLVWNTLLKIPIVGDLLLFIWDNRNWTLPIIFLICLICVMVIIWYLDNKSQLKY